MRRSRNSILGVAILGLLLAGIVGCGSGDSPRRRTASTTPPKTPDNGGAQPATNGGGGEPAPSEGGPAAAGGWGNLSGQLVFDGDPPEQAKLKVTKDEEFCNRQPPLDETLVVNKENRGLANVVMTLYLKRGDAAPPVHESYAETATEKVVLDNAFCRFALHIATMRTSQTLVVGNKDEVGHNTKADLFDNPAFNETIPAGSTIEKVFAKPERNPAPVSCSIHPWMTGYIVVRDHPYVAVTDADGKFTINNLPAGTWTFQAWQEHSGFVTDVNRDGKDEEWAKGRFEVTVAEGDNDLGVIKVKPEQFSK